MEAIKRQKSKRARPHEPMQQAKGETPSSRTGDQNASPPRAQTNAGQGELLGVQQDILAQALDKHNMQRAWRRVKANKGAAGIDQMDIAQTGLHLKCAWSGIRGQLLAGKYRPQPVRKVSIPKPQGGMRELGIPTVVDRLIQQALLQVLQPHIDPTFSDHSHGFRPNRRATDAVLKAQSYVQGGKRVVVDVDLEKFFDRVNHDILMQRLKRHITDERSLRLVRAYLDAGIMDGGVVLERMEGTPQGGPLSPLLANIMLDEVDKELERRGHSFVRYADDCNVYVASHKAGQRVMQALRKMYGKLKLKVNEDKSAVASAFNRKFLGYALWAAKGREVKRKASKQAVQRFKQQVRMRTRRSGGRSLAQVVEHLRPYMLGWKSYFGLAQTPKVWLGLDEWIRHRLRAIQLKQWRRTSTIRRELKKLGASDAVANLVFGNNRWWHSSKGYLHLVLNIAYFDKLGLPRLC
jgi:RNA-directed DNA polymerase